MNNLAALYQQQGDVEKAEPLLSDAHSVLAGTFGRDHRVVINIEENLEELTQHQLLTG